MKNNTISTRWFPKYGFCANHEGLSDNIFKDFDHQAEQFLGHDQSYLQLTSGDFRGRFLSAFLGPDVAIHMEYCSQALEQEVCGSPDHYTFGVILSDEESFIFKGSSFTTQDFFLLPPSGRFHLISPTHGAVMAISIQKDVFLRQMSLSPDVFDWVLSLENDIGFVRASRFAHRLREDAIAAIEGLAQAAGPFSGNLIGQALVTSATSKLALEWSGATVQDKGRRNQIYDRFQRCRNLLKSDHAIQNITAKNIDFEGISKRSIEQSFSKTVAMGPLTYLRVLRLHDVKRSLTNPNSQDRSIGDIAAAHGFWDWSRFSHQYRKHFGELPSTTRQFQSDNK